MKLQLIAVFCILQLTYGFKVHNDSTSSSDARQIQSPYRILGGEDISVDFKDVHCSVIFDNDTDYKCGCTIYNNYWIITSVNCIKEARESSDFRIISENRERDTGDEHDVDIFIRHEQFDPDTLFNDIAMVKVKEELPTTVTQLPSEPPKEGQELKLIGFGRLNITKIEPRIKQVIKLKTISNQRCNDIYGNRYIHPNHFCTLPRFGEGACYGDSGSPIVFNEGSDRLMLYGIVSFTIPCGIGKPDVFTDVSKYREWIQNKTSSIAMDAYNSTT